MANKNTSKSVELNVEDLGLGKGVSTETPVTKSVEESIFNRRKEVSYEDKKLEAAAAQAVKVAAESNAELALRESERVYAQSKRNHMLEKCKKDTVVTITPSKLYANIFGSVYSFFYNGIPVTVKFDGSPQQFPKFIADKIQEKILKTADANTPKDETFELS